MMRPWKLITLALGLAVLVAGAYYEQLADWDVGVSLVMGILTYLTAPFVVRTLYRLDWHRIPLALLLAWFSIDGSYWLYNEVAGHPYVREANALASTPLYFIMGLVWLWDGTLTQLRAAIAAAILQKRLPRRR